MRHCIEQVIRGFPDAAVTQVFYFPGMENNKQTPFDYLGEQGVAQLVDAFYDAMETLPEVRELRAMHATDLTRVRKGLTAYLTSWLGGPPVYVALHGSMCLTEAHAGFLIGPKARDQWLLCMEHALNSIAACDELKNMLQTPLQQIVKAVQNSPADAFSTRLIARG